MDSVFPKNRLYFLWGEFSFAFFWLTVLSGVVLVVFYNPADPSGSMNLSMQTNPYFNVIRDVHYFSANFFIVFLLLHFWDYFPGLSYAKEKRLRWFGLLISIFTSFYLMISGFILKGDVDSYLALDVFRGLMQRIPLAGNDLSLFFTGYGNDMTILYLQHSAMATIFTLFMIIEHSRRKWPTSRVFWTAASIILAISWLFNTPVKMPYERIVKGPWYFTGTQEILHHLSNPETFILLLTGYFLLLFWYPYSQGRWRKAIIFWMILSTILYAILTMIALIFRGENWAWI